MSKELAPIAIFVYRRPEHTKKMLQSLLACPEFQGSPVYVFCDGPKDATQVAETAETRSIVKSIIGSRATIFENAENIGLANSVIAGIDRVLEKHWRVIVVEDDLIVSPSFLDYLNAALNHFSADEKMMQISAYMFDYPRPVSNSESSTIVLPFPSSWGWATWKRAWNQFDPKASGWKRLFKIAQDKRSFDLDNSYDYSSMLYGQMTGCIDSWAIRWYWAIFAEKGVVLYPAKSLVLNRGFDGSGSHGASTARLLDTSFGVSETNQWKFPSGCEVNQEEFLRVKNVLRKSRGGLFHQLWRSRPGYWLRRKLSKSKRH